MLEQAHKDSLTGFYEREALASYLQRMLFESKEANLNFSIALLDLDHFKKFNDKYGHLFGDEILKYATSTLRLTFFEGQCVFFRYGGDEFIAVFPGKDTKEAFGLIRQAQYNLRHRPCLFENKFYWVTVSCGIAGFPQDAATSEELIQKADEAMYFSKKVGRNFTTLFSKISYLRLRRVLNFAAISVGIVTACIIGYHLAYQKIIRPTLGQIQNIKITTKPQYLDAIILKSGTVFEGKILSETSNKIILNLYMAQGEGQTAFSRSEVAEIKYGTKPAK